MDFFMFILGAFVVMLVDTFWWHIDYKKVEKGLEWHEHYHVGIELMILAVITTPFIPELSSFLYGSGFLFIAAEWRQAVEVIGPKVKAGHPFAFGSTHFTSSTIVGVILTVIAISSYILVEF